MHISSRVALRGAVAGIAVVGLTFGALQAQRGSGSVAAPKPSGTNAAPKVPTGTSVTLQSDFRPNRFMNFVFANPMPGKDGEFDDWYGNQHVPDLLEHPGYYAA